MAETVEHDEQFIAQQQQLISDWNTMAEGIWWLAKEVELPVTEEHTLQDVIRDQGAKGVVAILEDVKAKVDDLTDQAQD